MLVERSEKRYEDLVKLLEKQEKEMNNFIGITDAD